MKFIKPTPVQQLFHQNVPAWLDLRIIAIVVLLAIFGLSMYYSEPLQGIQKTATATALTTPAPPGGTPGVKIPTPLPAEWVNNYKMANGIILGAVILVLIVIGGTLGAIARRY